MAREHHYLHQGDNPGLSDNHIPQERWNSTRPAWPGVPIGGADPSLEAWLATVGDIPYEEIPDDEFDVLAPVRPTRRGCWYDFEPDPLTFDIEERTIDYHAAPVIAVPGRRRQEDA